MKTVGRIISRSVEQVVKLSRFQALLLFFCLVCTTIICIPMPEENKVPCSFRVLQRHVMWRCTLRSRG
jgi:hypothetical protein